MNLDGHITITVIRVIVIETDREITFEFFHTIPPHQSNAFFLKKG